MRSLTLAAVWPSVSVLKVNHTVEGVLCNCQSLDVIILLAAENVDDVRRCRDGMFFTGRNVFISNHRTCVCCRKLLPGLILMFIDHNSTV